MALFRMPLNPGSLVVSFNCISHRQIDSFVSRSQSCGPGRVTFNKASILFWHASLSACCLPWPVLRYQHPGHPSLRPHFSKSDPRKYVLATLFSQNFSWRSGHHLSGSLHSNLNVERIVTAIWGPGTARISSILPASHLSDSGILPDVRRPGLAR